MTKDGPEPRRGPRAKPREERIAAGEFKARCLALLDQVGRGDMTIVVTKRGRPVARLVGLAPDRPASLVGSLLHEEDLMSPVDAEWESAG